MTASLLLQANLHSVSIYRDFGTGGLRSLAFQITRTFACAYLASLHNFRNLDQVLFLSDQCPLEQRFEQLAWRHAIPAGFVWYARAFLNAYSRQVSSSRTERCAQNCYESTSGMQETGVPVR